MLCKLSSITRGVRAISKPSNANLLAALSNSFHSSCRLEDVKGDSAAPLYQYGGVHGTSRSQKVWRNKPLFRRDGDLRFKTGLEAAELLSSEAIRKDGHQDEFIQSWSSTMDIISPVFDRSPKFAWIAKLLLEPERFIQFRVAWLDDQGTARINRGFRLQYNSALGPYEGGTHFGMNVNTSVLKALALDRTFTNALTGANMGAAVGGSDFNPHGKSEAEIQRFCQSYMTELSKYIGPDLDIPGMGLSAGPSEIGYMYGQYKRTHNHISHLGRGLLWGGAPPFPHCTGFGVAHFAQQMLEDKGESLKGKRCLITGSGKNAQAVARKLLEFGAVPLTFSDSSGHIYEPDGLDAVKFKQVAKIKAERGARIGRYIIASTTARYNEPEDLFGIPCDLVFLCGPMNEVGAAAAQQIADGGALGVVEGCNMPCSPEAIKVFKKRGLLFAPYRATLAGASLVNGTALAHNRIASEADMDEQVARVMARTHALVKDTAQEFNLRGDLNAGASIAAFLKVADAMLLQGSV
ncbi:unnamed protein product [Heterosigma akashiwo]|uniref:glutamate dehydrogenase (NADP(+)) n=1 Tax=Heterosigma akashiwo TaxID=2829 RepID=A0A6V1RCQ3_HETAK|mmetsp:Transcript_2564/g.3452  ORF Transcript_2564/g.3452 Transcript_2564/m.3452 type:complete len:521 (+) Transcript_2564:84-1646(+)